MITLTLTQEEITVLGNLLDAANRHLGKAAAQAVIHFDQKIAAAVQAANAPSNIIPLDKASA